MNTRKAIIVAAVLLLALGASIAYRAEHRAKIPTQLNRLSLRLEWYPQAQFAGYIAAKDLGYYSQAGLDVDLRPAGPDLKPQVTVAAGTDDIGVGVSNQVITARANGVPLKIIAQVFQDSANRYVLKRQNAIHSLQDLRGKKVGLWLGGDEVEFVSMLKTAGLTLKDVQVIPQEYSVAPFLQDQYVLSEVTVYNELIQIRDQGYTGDQLQILPPADYNSAIVGDMLFTSENFLHSHPDEIRAFLSASFRGWQYCISNQAQCVDIILKYNKDLNREQQMKQLSAVATLITAGRVRTEGLGFMDPDAYRAASRILVDSGQIAKPVDPSQVFDATAWISVSAKDKEIK